MDKRNVQSFLMVSAAFFALSTAALRPSPAQASTNAVRPLSTLVSVSSGRVYQRGSKS